MYTPTIMPDKELLTSIEIFTSKWSSFCDIHKAPTDILTSEGFLNFCTIAGIDYSSRFDICTQDQKLMHSLMGYLRTDELRRKTDGIKTIQSTDNLALMMEDRVLPHLEFTIRNTIHHLPPDFAHMIICTDKSYDQIRNICDNICKNIMVVPCEEKCITQNIYNNMFMSKSFWTNIEYENILIYQQDTCLFRDGISDFMQYDYVGAPWPGLSDDNVIGVGNGGLSFRRKSKMLQCLDTTSPEDFPLGKTTRGYMLRCKLDHVPEDVYYSSTMLRHNIGKVSPRAVANQFSQECVTHHDPFGGHQYWLGNKPLHEEKRGNLLLIDDNFACDTQGQGFNRAKTVLEMLSKMFHITFMPTNYTPLDNDRSEYYETLGVNVILERRDLHGMKIYDVVGEHIKQHAGMYNIIYFSRPHNFGYTIDYCRKYSPSSKVIYDAEALFYKRIQAQYETTGKISLWPPCENPSEQVVAQEKTKELDMLARTDNVIVVSNLERDSVVNNVPALKGKVVVYGHAIAPQPTSNNYHEREHMLFVGSFGTDDTPNSDAMIHFVNNMFEELHERTGGKLYIIGTAPTETILSLASDKVEVLGYVEDVTPYYNNCRLFISPHRYAGGIPWKISEAMSRGLPVTVTTLLANQLGVKETHCGIGDTDIKFIEQAAQIYNDPDKWDACRTNSLQYIADTHDPAVHRQQLLDKLNSVLK